MAQLIETTRIGNEPELRYTAGGNPQAVINLSLPCEYGKRDQSTGKRQTQWVDATLWGKHAEALAPYLVKGQWVAVMIDDIHIEEYQSRGETRSKLVGRISSIKLVGARPDGQQQGRQQPPQRAQQSSGSNAYADARNGRVQHNAPPPDYDQFDDDIPF